MLNSRTPLVIGISVILYAMVNCLYVPNLHGPCLRCLCEAATGCNVSLGCSKGYCGPFKISRVFWIDAGRIVLPEDDPQRAGAYEDCARQYRCASRLVKSYMKKFGDDCNDDGVVNCDDYSMIHYNGPYGCSQPINHTDHFTRYASCRPPQSSVEDGYELFPGHGYYKLYTTGKTWDDASITCFKDNAHLMIINSDAEAHVVREFFSRKPQFHDVFLTFYVFIGFHDKFTEGEYMLVSGEPLASSGYVRWAPGQPNGGTRENYGGADKDGFLHDIVDSEKYGFICEKNRKR